MKKILSVIIILSFFLTSCLKDSTINTEGGLISTGTIIELPYTGLAYFNAKTVLTAGVTDDIVEPIVINIANSRGTLFSKDLNVTLAVNDALRVAYNTANGTDYQAMPVTGYSFPVKAGVIPAGQNLDTLYVTFYPEKIDPTKNYMLPIQLTDAEGQVISGNFSVAYYHTIGNPLAGNYNWDFYRWNNATGTGTDVGFKGDVTTFLPIDPTTITVPTAYYIAPRYILSFTNTAGVIGNYQLIVNPDDVKTMADAGVTIVDGPTILVANAVTGQFKFHTTYFNGAAYRYLIDDYYK
jgi:hypothetical protein